MKKTRADAKLLNLPEEQQARLAEWLLDGMAYHAARELVLKEFGVTTSLAALSGFFSEVCVPALLRRRSRAVGAADALVDDAMRNVGRVDAALIEALKQRAFEVLMKPNADPQEIAAVLGQALKSRDQSIKERQVELAESRWQFDAAKECLAHLAELRAIASDGGMDQAGKLEAVRRRLFGEAAEGAK